VNQTECIISILEYTTAQRMKPIKRFKK